MTKKTKVKMKTTLAGVGVIHNPGDVAEFSDAAAQRLLDRGLAEPVEGASKPKAKPKAKKEKADAPAAKATEKADAKD